LLVLDGVAAHSGRPYCRRHSQSRETGVPDTSPILDHLVIDVRDRMDEAARVFAGLGFQLTPRGHHTLGSMNHLMMFATDYLELLGFGEAGANRPELAPFPIGLNGLVFKTSDADRTHVDAAAAGLPILPVQAFSRPVTLDGATQDARFRTTRLDPGKIAMGRVYFCEHLTPELVWRPEWQAHPNGAKTIARVVVATPEPERSAELFRKLFGTEAVEAQNGSCVVAAGAARAQLTTPQAVSRELGEAAPDPAGRQEYLAAVDLTVGSLAETAKHLASVPGLRKQADRLVVPAKAAFNTTLVFLEAR
jgi:catechol 2,3-dioxygenase-like lactoylglutathione lyase family enzyme